MSGITINGKDYRERYDRLTAKQKRNFRVVVKALLHGYSVGELDNYIVLVPPKEPQ